MADSRSSGKSVTKKLMNKHQRMRVVKIRRAKRRTKMP